MNINELIQNDPKFKRFHNIKFRSIYFWYDYDNNLPQNSIIKYYQNQMYGLSIKSNHYKDTKQHQIELDKLNENFLNIFEINS